MNVPREVPTKPVNSVRLAAQFLRVSAMNDLQYRANFVLQVLQSMLALGAGLVGLAIVFSRTTELAGWTRPELLAVIGVFTMMGGVTRMVIAPNMQQLVDDVQRGTLDYALTKPADSQTLVSVRQVQIWQGVDVVAGLIVLVVALVQMGDRGNTIGRSLSFVALFAVGAWCIYCFWLMLAATAFWLTRAGEIQELFQGLFQSGRYPVGVYPGWMRFGLTFVVPVGFAVTVPSEAVSGRLTWGTAALAVGVAVGLGLVSRLVWRRGVRRYGGASA